MPSEQRLLHRLRWGFVAFLTLAALSAVASPTSGGSAPGRAGTFIDSAWIAAQEYGLSTFQTRTLECLRFIENGRPGREYGALHPRAVDTDELTQARWAAGSIKKRLPCPAALAQFAERWAPLGAENDPRGLNRYWLGNMTACLSRGAPAAEGASI